VAALLLTPALPWLFLNVVAYSFHFSCLSV
jgi:hypothetical protein